MSNQPHATPLNTTTTPVPSNRPPINPPDMPEAMPSQRIAPRSIIADYGELLADDLKE